MEYYGDCEVSKKDDESPVTKADIEANKIIVEGIMAEHPESVILSEESMDDKKRLEKEEVWIVDPLDGTKEFIKQRDEFTVNIAITKNKQPMMGVVYLPAKKELYYAEKGTGAFREQEQGKTRIRASGRETERVLVKSRSHSGEKEQKLIEQNNFSKVLEAGSSLKGCIIAAGEADVYYRFGNTSEWDICAMHAILNEAGGKLTNLNGEEVTYNNEEILIKGFIASNGKKHDELVKMGEIDG